MAIISINSMEKWVLSLSAIIFSFNELQTFKINNHSYLLESTAICLIISEVCLHSPTHSMGGKLMPPIPYERLNFDGSNGCPLNGDPSASHADFNYSIYDSSSSVGNPIYFRYCSYIILRSALFIIKAIQSNHHSRYYQASN